MSETFPEGATCRPNFSAAGRKRRRNVAIVGAVLAVGMMGAFVGFHVWWPLRLLVVLPAGAAFVSGLQVTRNTCVAHAATGMFEGEDMRLSKVDEVFAEASRKVAATIWRDSALGMAAVALVAALSSYVA